MRNLGFFSTPSENEKECDMFGAFGFFVQLTLGVLSFMVLVIKRLKERPRRPWKIWFLDVSKQGFSSCVAHLINLLLAVMLTEGGTSKADQCIWYFINITVDTSFGVTLIYICMAFIEMLAKSYDIKLIQSGLYYQIYEENGKMRTKLNLTMYFSQLTMWVIVVCFVKFILFFFQKAVAEYLEDIGIYILSPVKSGRLKLLIVMIFVPFVFNAIQFWIQDNFLKYKPVSDSSKDEKILDSKTIEAQEKQLTIMKNNSNRSKKDSEGQKDKINIELK